jgi:hypothetical protein
MITFEEKIATYERETEEVKRKIERGSDEHLDLLLSIKESLEKLGGNLNRLIKDIVPDLNSFTEEDLNKAGPILLDAYSSTISLVAQLKRSSVAKDLKATCSDFYMHVDDLREVIHDIERFRLMDDAELDQLMRDINES